MQALRCTAAARALRVRPGGRPARREVGASAGTSACPPDVRLVTAPDPAACLQAALPRSRHLPAPEGEPHAFSFAKKAAALLSRYRSRRSSRFSFRSHTSSSFSSLVSVPRAPCTLPGIGPRLLDPLPERPRREVKISCRPGNALPFPEHQRDRARLELVGETPSGRFSLLPFCSGSMGTLDLLRELSTKPDQAQERSGACRRAW